jgi:hypothetical protein
MKRVFQSFVELVEAWSRLAGRYDDDQSNYLLEDFVWYGEGQTLGHSAMYARLRVHGCRQSIFLNLERRQYFSTTVDDFFVTACDVKIPVLIEMANIACVEPSILVEHGGIDRIIVAEIPREYR